MKREYHIARKDYACELCWSEISRGESYRRRRVWPVESQAYITVHEQCDKKWLEKFSAIEKDRHKA